MTVQVDRAIKVWQDYLRISTTGIILNSTILVICTHGYVAVTLRHNSSIHISVSNFIFRLLHNYSALMVVVVDKILDATASYRLNVSR